MFSFEFEFFNVFLKGFCNGFGLLEFFAVVL